jgi:hypothetical protein
MNEVRVCSDVVIVVASCDRYCDLWAPFFYLLRKNCPALKLRIYLVTNDLKYAAHGVISLNTGPDVTWSANLKAALQVISEPYVLLLLEDLLVLRPINPQELMTVLSRIIESGANCVKLNPLPPPDARKDELMGVVSPGVPYRVSTVATVWRKQVLLELLEPSESPWQFEIAGSVRSSAIPDFYACYEQRFPVMNAVVRGRWRRGILSAAEALGAPVDRAARGVMNGQQSAWYRLACMRYEVLQAMPPRLRFPIRSVFRGA